ncbi:hypothetical protein VNO77_18896 [Canavalia gladiata]|uniref:Uncharacterized protein n=1 Tax=Canavalia gladiata TaxID=3824 RepID=A0AAN9LMD9_CANGL
MSVVDAMGIVAYEELDGIHEDVDARCVANEELRHGAGEELVVPGRVLATDFINSSKEGSAIVTWINEDLGRSCGNRFSIEVDRLEGGGTERWLREVMVMPSPGHGDEEGTDFFTLY